MGYVPRVSRLRVVLLYPPPWKIPAAGESSDPKDGPPPSAHPTDLDADFFQIPYGLLSLAAQARQAGHAVKVLNLSGLAWNVVEAALGQLHADVVGLSCWTANRHGVALVANAIKQAAPHTHIAVGGPHATALPSQLLTVCPSIDSVLVGESEATFLELLERLGRNEPLDGLAGAFYRTASSTIAEGPRRARITPLDQLASVHAHFPTHIVMTSRGCPWACTFCGAEASWGRGFRSFSVDRVLYDIEQALARAPVRILLFKDDTFTADRKRALAICRGIRERGLSFLWSCDTRVDVLDPELLLQMRLAGCERLSLGVESGSASILRAINKRTTPEQIIATTKQVRDVGIQARFYMMLGNRGETRATFEESLAFLERARPHQAIFSCLSIYPGTRDWNDALRAGWLEESVFVRERFQELKVPFDASPEDAALMSTWFEEHRGLLTIAPPNVAELTAVLERLGGHHHAAHADLAYALLEAGELDSAERHLQQAEANHYPLPGLLRNAHAVIAHRRGDSEAMKAEFVRAARTDPQHYVLLQNAARARHWFMQGGPATGAPLELLTTHDFSLFERTVQPMLPGPIPEDFAVWEGGK